MQETQTVAAFLAAKIMNPFSDSASMCYPWTWRSSMKIYDMILKDPLKKKRSDRKLHILVTQCHKISVGKPQGSGSKGVWRDSSPIRQSHIYFLSRRGHPRSQYVKSLAGQWESATSVSTEKWVGNCFFFWFRGHTSFSLSFTPHQPNTALSSL